MERQPAPGQLVDAASTFAKVPGLTFPTDMRKVRATYRVLAPAFPSFGYYGLGLEMLDGNGKPIAIILVNRLFRLPLIFREPFGVLIDAATTGALLSGIRIAPVRAAANTASLLYGKAAARDAPLIFSAANLWLAG
jgi:hypothetical protein